jgi:hypothetical protein
MQHPLKGLELLIFRLLLNTVYRHPAPSESEDRVTLEDNAGGSNPPCRRKLVTRRLEAALEEIRGER